MNRRCIFNASLGSALLWGLLVAVFLVLAGCAVGRGPAGEIVTGVKVGELVETAGEAANAAATFLPPPLQLRRNGSALNLGRWRNRPLPRPPRRRA